jgi:DNA-binding HxlR family transcriptional regulator
MRQTSFADFHCSLARSLEVIGDWWTPLIIRDLNHGLDRFDDVAANLGISRNLLTARLKTLVDANIVERVRYCDHPPRDSYRLTAAGQDLVPILAALTAWGDRWTPPPAGPPVLYSHDGHRCTPTVTCSTCGRPVTAENLGATAGPGAAAGPGTHLIDRLFAQPGDPDPRPGSPKGVTR